MKNNLILLLNIVFFSLAGHVNAQDSTTVLPPVLDYEVRGEYEIGAVKVTGNKFSDERAIISISGLKVGKKIAIPGDSFRKAITALWKLKLYTDIQIIKEKTVGEIVFLEIRVSERPRLSKYSYKGVKKSSHDELNKEIDRFLTRGGIVTADLKSKVANGIKEYFLGKGFPDTEVKIDEIVDDKSRNSVRLEFDITVNERVKISEINFSGNENVKTKRLKKKLKNTKRKNRIFGKSKFIKDEFEEDKLNIVNYYNTLGFRDAKVVKDSIYRNEEEEWVLDIDIEEGNRYVFRDITWKGNSLYDSRRLTEILGIEKGDIYNEELLNQRLSFSQDGRDITTLYMDDGYLFFRVDPIEVSIEKDSIDLEMRIYEGPQATIDQVTITGNDRTHEHVIRRSLRTKPGAKFSRSDIIRSQREILNLGYFNPEKFDIQTPVNPERGTVDIQYGVEERPSDQLELSAGWGGFSGVIGTLGVTFNNFSLRNLFKKGAWKPLPQGDGQKLSIRAQSNGRFFQSYNFSFTEPWLGGKRPNSFSLGAVYTKSDQTSIGGGSLAIARFFAGLGTQLKFPDDNFVSNTTFNLENITLNQFTGFVDPRFGTRITDGKFNNFNIRQTIARSTVDSPLYPRQGALVSLTMQFTPPYSLFRDDNDEFATGPATEVYKFVEYHKWRFDAEWYFNIFDKFVVKAGMKIGILGSYNEALGVSPFERFELGGDGLSNQTFGIFGKDILKSRGYEQEEFPANAVTAGGATAFEKISLELRYPLSLNPNSTIYGLMFLEGSNSWLDSKDFNPFDMKRAAGFGLRIFLPMFGLLGFDYGFGFDKPNLIESGAKPGAFGQFQIILGFEPE